MRKIRPCRLNFSFSRSGHPGVCREQGFGGAVADKLNGEQQSYAPDVSDEWMVNSEPFQLPFEIGPYLRGVLHKVFRSR